MKIKVFETSRAREPPQRLHFDAPRVAQSVSRQFPIFVCFAEKICKFSPLAQGRGVEPALGGPVQRRGAARVARI